MIAKYDKNIGLPSPETEERSAQGRVRHGTEDICRCKEVSLMKPPKLFKLMVNDLAFWKKKKKK